MPDTIVAELGPVEKAILEDLNKSGLYKSRSFPIRELTDSERAACNIGAKAIGYVIPYYFANGSAKPFYRVKVLNAPPGAPKYLQPKRTPNHIYFPPGLTKCLLDWKMAFPASPLLVITEGEKKASAAVHNGIPAVAVSGVASWRSKTLILPGDSEIAQTQSGHQKKLRVSLSTTNGPISETHALAQGFAELVDLVMQHQLYPILVYDSDKGGTLKPDVQRECTMLAYEMRYQGIPTSRIKQYVLPDIGVGGASGAGIDGDGDGKTGLDDYLKAKGSDALVKALIPRISDPKAFPKHPNAKGYINSILASGSNRRDATQVASVVLAELDARGMRLSEEFSGRPYYYDFTTHKLMRAIILNDRGDILHEAVFGKLLYQEFGLTGNDSRVLVCLASQFTGEPPITTVRPRRVMCHITVKEDPKNSEGIAIQAGDEAYFAISPHRDRAVVLKKNGEDGLLFEQDQVEPIDTERVFQIFDELYEASERHERPDTMDNWWGETLDQTNLGKLPTATDEDGNTRQGVDAAGRQMRRFANLLFYVNPYFRRWRHAQLPVEFIIGEPGSGKSSIYELRLAILTGRPHLRNLPVDIKDWYASLANAGGLHVTDNVNIGDGKLRQQMSDEICRLITEPNPMIEQRRYYTNTEVLKTPVDISFAMTSLQMPFQNADLIQRAAIFEACAAGRLPEGDWVQHQLEERGGREAWIAHHLLFCHLFLRRAQKEWNYHYRTQHRLAHFEQCMSIAAKILRMDIDNIGNAIRDTQVKALEEADLTLAGIKEFCRVFTSSKAYKESKQFARARKFSAADIAEWAANQDDFSKNDQLCNARRLGRYIQQHRTSLLRATGIQPAGTDTNRQLWKVVTEEDLK